MEVLLYEDAVPVSGFIKGPEYTAVRDKLPACAVCVITLLSHATGRLAGKWMRVLK